MKKSPIITKQQFLEIIDLLKRQEQKDNEFCDFMEKYLDGRFVPMISEHSHNAAVKLLEHVFEDTEGQGWITWFLYDNNFGENKHEATIGKKKYIISNAEKMYDLLVKLMNTKDE